MMDDGGWCMLMPWIIKEMSKKFQECQRYSKVVQRWFKDIQPYFKDIQRYSKIIIDNLFICIHIYSKPSIYLRYFAIIYVILCPSMPTVCSGARCRRQQSFASASGRKWWWGFLCCILVGCWYHGLPFFRCFPRCWYHGLPFFRWP